ncbi:MAG: thiamine-phosphate kinase [Thaumarchaeota archaeon]|nr:thiamine-phosphate kinase [Nitrososphaerota archaeon]
MSKLDEKKIIEIFQKSFVANYSHSEDVELFRLGKNFGVIKTDTLVQSTDVPPQMSSEQIAQKSIVAPISDFAAKGVRPLYGIISVSLPKNYPKITQLAKGFRVASKQFGIKILGGDTNEAKEIVISVTLFGIAKKIIPRNGAKNGDIIVTTNNFGRTAAGLGILLYKNKADGKFRKIAKDAVLSPKPRLDFGILASKHINSSMDSSDGLSTTLSEMAKASKKKFVITHIPKDQGLDEFAKINHRSIMDLVFNGGEEYEIVATICPKNIEKLEKIAKACKISLIQIGHVQNGQGVFLERNKKQTRIADKGWSHFS